MGIRSCARFYHGRGFAYRDHGAYCVGCLCVPPPDGEFVR
jgi:hypothetical protein